VCDFGNTCCHKERLILLSEVRCSCVVIGAAAVAAAATDAVPTTAAAVQDVTHWGLIEPVALEQLAGTAFWLNRPGHHFGLEDLVLGLHNHQANTACLLKQHASCPARVKTAPRC